MKSRSVGSITDEIVKARHRSLVMTSDNHGKKIKVALTIEQASQYAPLLVKGAYLRCFGHKHYRHGKLTKIEPISLSKEQRRSRKGFDYKKGYALLGYRPDDVTIDDICDTIREKGKATAHDEKTTVTG